MTISTTTLKNAARAIECDLWTDPATGANYLAKDGAILRRWEPAEDDGDALRLALMLKITIEISGNDDEFYEVCCGAHWESFFFDRDAPAAARRVIVLAAASIGEYLCQ